MNKLIFAALPLVALAGCATVPTSEPMTSYQRIVAHHLRSKAWQSSDKQKFY